MHSLQRGAACSHSNMCSMLSSALRQSRHFGSWVRLRLCTLSARWTSLRHCRSSVGSDSGVPNDSKISLKGSLWPMRWVQLAMQLGCAPLVMKVVRCAVMLWIVKSDSLRGLPFARGLWCSMYHPSLRGKVVVAGPMIAGGGLGWRFASSASLPYVGGGSVGESSHTVTGVSMVRLGLGSITRPVRWGRGWVNGGTDGRSDRSGDGSAKR